MPAFTYTGDDARYYPTLGLEATPGLVAELDAMPTDGRWVLAAVPAPAPDVAPVALVEAPASVPSDFHPSDLAI